MTLTGMISHARATTRRAARWLSLTIVLGLLVAPAAGAALRAGDPDPQFSGGGLRLLPTVTLGAGQIEEAVPDGAGGIVGAGGATVGDDTVLWVVRRDAAGARVASFAANGDAVVTLPITVLRVYGIGRQPSGRTIVLAGHSSRRYLVALTATGLPDAGFAGGGILPLTDTALPLAARLAVDAAGRILLTGEPGVDRVLRLTANGATDLSYGMLGLAALDLPGPSEVRAIAAGPSGTAVVSAFLHDGDGRATATKVLRLLDTGAPDLAFGDDGVATPPHANETEHKLLVRPGGEVLLILGVAVLALTPSGAADSGFSGDGALRDSGNEPNRDAALDAAGRLYLVTDRDEPADGPEIARYGGDGTPDAGFGIVSLPEVNAFLPRLVGEAAGVLVTGSARHLALRPLRGRFGVLTRLLDSGARDPATGPTGVLVRMGDTRQGYTTAVAAGAAGSMVLTGTAWDDTRNRLLVARVLADGTPDPAFGSDGRVLLDIGSRWLSGNAITLDGDRPVVAATAWYPNGLLLLRLSAGGGPDASFGAGGMRELSVPGLTSPRATALAVDGDGRLLVGGQATAPSGRAWPVIFRLLPSGELDPSFSDDGVAVLPVPGQTSADSWRMKLAALPDGGVVFAGSLEELQIERGYVARLMADGTPDPGFSDDGVRILDRFVEMGAPGGLEVDEGGRVLLAGYSEAPPAGMRLLRLTAAGEPDGAFGSGGSVAPAVGRELPVDLVRAPDGRIVLPTFEADRAGPVGGVVRLNADGSADTSFGDGGRAALPPRLSMNFGGGVVVRPDGAITVAGGRQLSSVQTPTVAAVAGLLGSPRADVVAPPPPPPPRVELPAPADPPAAVSPPPPALPAPSAAATLRVKLGVTAHQSRATIRRRGLRLRVSCTSDCRLTAVTTARRAGRSLGVARTSARLTAGRTVTVTVRLPARTRRALARRGRATLAVRLSALAASGTRATARRTVTLPR